MSGLLRCNPSIKGSEGMLSFADFKILPVPVIEGVGGDPDSVDIFMLKVTNTTLVKSITAGTANVQTSDENEAPQPAAQQAVAPDQLTVKVNPSFDETVDNQTGLWAYTFTLDLVLKGNVVVNGYQVTLLAQSPFVEQP